MNYNIFDSVAPAMPKPSKGTEFCKLLLSKASKDMREPLVPMAMPALSAHLTNVKFKYSDNKYYELCGQMGHLIGPSGIGKDQLHESLSSTLSLTFHMFPDRDEPGERLFLQLKEVLPSLVHHQLPPGCKDFSEKYLKALLNPPV